MNNQARTAENNKSPEEKRKEWSYVGAHTATCIASDFATPYFSALWARGNIETPNFKNLLIEHLSGELIGDLAAVPATIAVQRFAPELMEAIRFVAEPIYRPFYEDAARREAQIFVHQNRLDAKYNPFEKFRSYEEYATFEEYRTQKLEYEMSKMPLQIVWTGLSFGLNVMSQQLMFDKKETLEENIKSVAVGALITVGLQNISRIAAPRQMHAFDDFVDDHIVTPTNRILGIEHKNDLSFSNSQRLQLQNVSQQPTF